MKLKDIFISSHVRTGAFMDVVLALSQIRAKYDLTDRQMNQIVKDAIKPPEPHIAAENKTIDLIEKLIEEGRMECVDCDAADHGCEFAWDPYNVDGRCLQET